MTNIIQQLPDRLANQIAAGEVIQRPASVVKELLENAIDAQATEITLIIKDAGKQLIQVIDNGMGMSPIDARMCFERHATSKIQNIEDLFTVRTMGFRGEAMASIAAVAQVELLTNKDNDNAGTQIIIEGGQFKSQEQHAAVQGTSISVKNLFFNVPARRKFLKSNTAEMRHIVEEFTRVAMAYPAVSFKLIHNDTEQQNLRPSSLKSRIVDLLGARFDKYLVPVDEETDYFRLIGFVGKPEIASRNKGNQYFFINNRFIKSPYLHHAITIAYENLIHKEETPFYCLYFDIDPTKVDVNVHPTKQEVKFEDERTMYSYLKSMVTHVLARFNIAPSLDFTLNPEIQNLDSLHTPVSPQRAEQLENSFLRHSFAKANSAHFIPKTGAREQWESTRNNFFDQNQAQTISSSATSSAKSNLDEFIHFPNNEDVVATQTLLWKHYIVSPSRSGIVLVHVHRAQERIVYDQMLNRYLYQKPASQKLLFPEILEFNSTEVRMLDAVSNQLLQLGFQISSMGKNAVAVHAVPPELIQTDVRATIEEILEQQQYSEDYQVVQDMEKILRISARQVSLKYQPSTEANQALLGQLFASSQPEYAPSGTRIIHTITAQDLDHYFK